MKQKLEFELDLKEAAFQFLRKSAETNGFSALKVLSSEM
jgi:hypothetical protein